METFKILNARLASQRLATIEVRDGRIIEVRDQNQAMVPPPPIAVPVATLKSDQQAAIIDATGNLIVPAALDVHIHARDPGLVHKEDWTSIGRCARQGGVAAVVDMPNTIPPTLTAADVEQKAELARKSGIAVKILLGVSARNIGTIGQTLRRSDLPIVGVKVFYGPSTGDLVFSDLEALGKNLPADGRRLVVFHSEDQCGIDCNKAELVNDYEAAKQSTTPSAYAIHSQLRSSSTAWTSTQIILDWAVTWKGPVHLAHVSTPREIDMVLNARSRGAQITCEVAPHHLLLSTRDYDRLGGFLKVNPPVRSLEEVAALRQHMTDGHIDMIATDHAPHTIDEKKRPYEGCPSGMPSLDFFYPLAFEIGRICKLSVERVVELASTEPAKRFGFDDLGQIAVGKEASFVWIEEKPWTLTAKEVVSKCGWTPYDGMSLPARVRVTWLKGRNIYCG